MRTRRHDLCLYVMSLDVKIKQFMSKTIKMYAVSLKLKFERQYIFSINVYRCFNS